MTVSVNSVPIKPAEGDFESIVRALELAGSLYGLKLKSDEIAALKDQRAAQGKLAEQTALLKNEDLLRQKDKDAVSARLAQAQIKKLEAEKAKIGKENVAGKNLSPGDQERFGQGREAIKQLNALQGIVESNTAEFGPIQGRIGSINPYATTAQTVQASVNTAKQTIGKYLEGGVLRKEDEEKYAKILPTLADTPEVANQKISIVRDMLNRKLSGDVAALQKQGYNTQGLEVPKFGSGTPALALPNKKKTNRNTSTGLEKVGTAQAAPQFDINSYIGGK